MTTHTPLDDEIDRCFINAADVPDETAWSVEKRLARHHALAVPPARARALAYRPPLRLRGGPEAVPDVRRGARLDRAGVAQGLGQPSCRRPVGGGAS